MSDDVKWEDPPATTRGTGKWRELLAPLRERPGEWANLGVHTLTSARSIRLGHVSGAEAGEFEAVTRGQKDSKATIYARYIGKPDLKAAAEAS
jgi:hypothetical protein